MMTTSSTPDQPSPQEDKKAFSFAPRSQSLSEPAREILKADRQRRLQRYLILMAAMVIVGLGLSFISLNQEEDIKIQVDAKITPQEKGELILEGVTYKGITRDGNDFVVLASSAAENPDQPDQIKLTSPRARVDTNAGNPMTARSNHGLFFRADDKVDLDGRVVIVRPDLGYTLLTERAVAHLDTGMMTSDVLVRGYAPHGEVQADGMVIKDHGQEVLFTGKSVLTLNQDATQ
jgi:LPS export ABC transporter protein LptC